jgi:hypothetical protein
MDENLKPTPEELQEEEIALKDSKEEEIRSSIIEKYELNEDDNEDLIDKLTADILAQRKSFGKVVKQKRTYRELAQKAIPGKDEKPQTLSKEEIEKSLEEKFFNRDLEELDYSDNVKDAVKKICKVNNLSVKQAQKDPYIQYLIEQETDEKILDKSAISQKKNSIPGKTDAKPLNPDNYDFSTKEGRDKWEADKKARNK